LQPGSTDGDQTIDEPVKRSFDSAELNQLARMMPDPAEDELFEDGMLSTQLCSVELSQGLVKCAWHGACTAVTALGHQLHPCSGLLLFQYQVSCEEAKAADMPLNMLCCKAMLTHVLA